MHQTTWHPSVLSKAQWTILCCVNHLALFILIQGGGAFNPNSVSQDFAVELNIATLICVYI